MCKTADLIALVQDSGALKPAPKAEAKAETKNEERVEVPASNGGEYVDIVARAGYRDWETDRKSTRLNSSHSAKSRMPSSA